MAFIVGIDGVRSEAAFRLGILDILEVWLFVPGAPFVLTLREVEHQLHRFVRRNVPKNGLSNLPIWSRAFMNMLACVISRVRR